MKINDFSLVRLPTAAARLHRVASIEIDKE